MGEVVEPGIAHRIKDGKIIKGPGNIDDRKGFLDIPIWAGYLKGDFEVWRYDFKMFLVQLCLELNISPVSVKSALMCTSKSHVRVLSCILLNRYNTMNV